ncbi:hypothetical protein [Legionella cardiaca]|uniref:Substrate of the Dot/Icm secretion system n=1 Tax=Legionella cardiaca TaxID=1071983 RepID=A0ABY8APG9_9GAMM|nr:hypothetical protein [Legionella cardiaca]WED42329.1 hypothetical protein PXX05_10370 [Legionella cardiaca]
MIERFTDNHLANLYLKLSSKYKALSKQTNPKLDRLQIYQRLLDDIRFELTSPQSHLHQLDPTEHYKVYTVLNTFFSATESTQQPSDTRPHYVFTHQPVNIHDPCWHEHRCFIPTNDFLFTWLLLDSLSNRGSYHSSGCFGGDSHHEHSSKDSEAKIFLLLLLFAALTAGMAFIAAYYLIRESIDSIERLWFNEGSLQAIVSLSSAIASTVVTGVVASIFTSTPLMMFALAAGLSTPVGFMVFGVICLTLIGGALGCFITNQIQSAYIKGTNPHSLDPSDPYRFGLSEEETQNLVSKGYDPIKVKCAIAELHAQIGKEMPPLLHRIFSDSSDKQQMLDTIRKLRRGEAEAILVVGKGARQLSFNLLPNNQRPPEVSHGHHSTYADSQFPGYPSLVEPDNLGGNGTVIDSEFPGYPIIDYTATPSAPLIFD